MQDFTREPPYGVTNPRIYAAGMIFGAHIIDAKKACMVEYEFGGPNALPWGIEIEIRESIQQEPLYIITPMDKFSSSPSTWIMAVARTTIPR